MLGRGDEQGGLEQRAEDRFHTPLSMLMHVSPWQIAK